LYIPFTYLQSTNEYLGKYSIFSEEELGWYDEIYHLWIKSGNKKRLSINELLTIFPEAKPLVKKQFKKEKKLLGERLDNLKDSRNTIQSRDQYWFRQLIDEEIDKLSKEYKRYNILLKYPLNSLNNNYLEKAKQYPICDLLGINPTKEKMSIKCPLHNDRSPSMTIYTTENRWHCFAGCGFGDVIDLYCKLNNTSIAEAIKVLS